MRFKAAVLQMRSGLVPSDNVATVAADDQIVAGIAGLKLTHGGS